MPNDHTTDDAVSTNVAHELVELLTSKRFEEFMGLFRSTALARGEEGAVQLAEVVNDTIRTLLPECEVKLIVSQRTEGKHIIMISDSSRFFGDSWTVSRQMFVV